VMKAAIVFALLAFFALGAVPQVTADGGIVYGEDFAFTVVTPKGWVLDTESAKSQGVAAAVYPEGQSWAEAPTVMYFVACSKDNKTLDEFIKEDVAEFKAASEDLKVRELPDTKTVDGRKTKCREFRGDKHGNVERAVYVEAQKVFFTIVLSARSEEQFKSSVKAFEGLLKSVAFLDVRVEGGEAERGGDASKARDD
jgi:hypothetical protein